MSPFVLGAPGCSEEALTSPCQSLYADVEERFGPDGEVPGFIPEDRSSLVVKVENDAAQDRPLLVDVDGETVIDIELPGSHGCDHPPVLTFGLDQAPGDVVVHVVSGAATASERVAIADGEPTWVVVQLSEDAVMSSVWDTRPQFG